MTRFFIAMNSYYWKRRTMLAFEAAPGSPAEDWWRGEVPSRARLRFRWERGSAVCDFLRGDRGWLISHRAAAALREAGLSGWTTHPATLLGKDRVELPGYSALMIRGRAKRLDLAALEKHEVPNEFGGVSEFWTGVHLQPEDSDGSDLFLVDRWPELYVTERVEAVVREHGLSGIELEDVGSRHWADWELIGHEEPEITEEPPPPAVDLATSMGFYSLSHTLAWGDEFVMQFEPAVEAERGEWLRGNPPAEPPLFRRTDGEFKCDFHRAGTEWLVSPRVVTAFRNAGITGWDTYPAVVRERFRRQWKGYRGLIVHGRAERLDDSGLVKHEHTSRFGGTSRHWTGMRIREEDWDGSNLFLVGNGWSMYATESVVATVLDAGLTGLAIEDVSEMHWQAWQLGIPK